jgi:hypothetical protein
MPRPEAHVKTKIDPANLADAERKLMGRGFFSPASEEAKSSPPMGFEQGIHSQRKTDMEQFLRTAWKRILDLSTVFGRYQSPKSPIISAPFIASFLRQLETVSLARIMLKLLEAVEFKDRHFFAEALADRITTAIQTTGVDFVCPLGATGDSSALLSYFVGDLPRSLQRPVKPLELALEMKNASILLYDDFCGLGRHAITTFAQWMGVQKGFEVPLLHEKLADELTDERKEQLARSTVRIAFSLAYKTGIRNLAAALKRCGLSKIEIIEQRELVPEIDEIFDGRDSLLSAEEQEEMLPWIKNKSRAIMSELRLDDAVLLDRLLGYGNKAKLLVFFYNVPTVTLTPLWFAPTDKSWFPLFIRRQKTKIEPDIDPSAAQSANWNPQKSGIGS